MNLCCVPYARFLSIIAISKPTTRIVTIIAMDTGKKTWSIIDAVEVESAVSPSVPVRAIAFWAVDE
jgi:hypothetical protein